MAASVWMAPEIEKPFGASIVRPRADTMPAVTVPVSPNGLPMAIAGIAGPQVLGGAELERLQLVADLVGIDLEQREVDRRVGPEQLRLDRLAVLAEAHAVPARGLDDMVVGDDVALVVDHEARAGGALAGLHEHDAGGDALVERGDVERVARGGVRRLGRAGGWLGLVVERAREGEDTDDGADRHRAGDEEQQPAHAGTF